MNISADSPGSWHLLLNLALSYITLCLQTKCFSNFVIFFPVCFWQSQRAHDIISLISHCVDKRINLIFRTSFTDPRCYAESLESSNPIWPAAKIAEVEMFRWAYWEQSIHLKYLVADFGIFPRLTHTPSLAAACCRRFFWNLFFSLKGLIYNLLQNWRGWPSSLQSEGSPILTPCCGIGKERAWDDVLIHASLMNSPSPPPPRMHTLHILLLQLSWEKLITHTRLHIRPFLIMHINLSLNRDFQNWF